MTFHSMTGFGSGESSSHGWTMKVECRSVNHRGLDVRVWAPRDWAWIEPFVLNAAREMLHRGRVEVRVDVAPSLIEGEAPHVDMKLFGRVGAELRRAADAAGFPPPTTADVLAFDHVRLSAERADLPEDTTPFEAGITEGLSQLAQSRADEGARLRLTMDSLLDQAAGCVARISEQAPTVGDEYRTRLEQRMHDALQRFEVGELDERAILHEVALYADRSDVSEELQRAASHVDKLREVFTVSGEPVGKKLDFYLQELFREANTTGSKSGSLAITDEVIALKTAIEKMREQAANIE